jgi:hypothetical protein
MPLVGASKRADVLQLSLKFLLKGERLLMTRSGQWRTNIVDDTEWTMEDQQTEGLRIF